MSISYQGVPSRNRQTGPGEKAGISAVIVAENTTTQIEIAFCNEEP
jgi:hypothetical protein